MSHDCEKRGHKWKFVKDWYGDPNVINGTADCSYWECKKCGLEQRQQPDDWEPYYPEYEHDDIR